MAHERQLYSSLQLQDCMQIKHSNRKKSRHETEQIRSAYLTIQMQDAVDGSTKWCDRHGEKDGIQQGVGIIEQ